jgi:HSP20 family protein
MSTESKDMEIQEQEIAPDKNETTRECRCFVPKADIYEVDENIIVVLDMPGINENAIDITLEKNILKVKGLAQMVDYGDCSLAYAEYEPGDYERSFRITDAIDRENTEANYKNGVLRLVLPKAETPKTRRIAVKIG